MTFNADNNAINSGKRYVMSDIHGCYDAYIDMLKKINLGDNDMLYVIGDAVDRGTGGIDIIMDIMNRSNVTMLLGNHDFDLNVFGKIYLNCPEMLEADKDISEVFKRWLYDGGMPTFDAFKKLERGKQEAIIAFLDSLHIKKHMTVNGVNYLMSHSVPALDDIPECGLTADGNMIIPPVKEIDQFEFIKGEPDYECVYNPDCIIVTGHTPTVIIDSASSCKIWKGNNHIAVDCGAVFGYSLGCICLDTMEEYYIRTERQWGD